MKYFIALFVLLFAVPAHADQYVNGYYRSNGTYVQPYYRSSPDGNPYNNYSTYGNVNPYTGEAGTRHVSPSYAPSEPAQIVPLQQQFQQPHSLFQTCGPFGCH